MNNEILKVKHRTKQSRSKTQISAMIVIQLITIKDNTTKFIK